MKSKDDLFHQLTYYSLSLGDEYFIHQLVVDAYAAQTATKGDKPIKIMFALVGLYLVNEHGYTGKEVQNVHVALANANDTKEWPMFSLPGSSSILTIDDVLAVPDENKQEMIKKWHAEVWSLWKNQEDVVKTTLEKYLHLSL